MIHEETIELLPAYYDITVQTDSKCVNEKFVIGIYVVHGKEKQYLYPTVENNCSAEFRWTSDEMYYDESYSLEYSIIPLMKIEYKYKRAAGPINYTATILKNISLTETVKLKFMTYNETL